ncbi:MULTISPECIES: hypothetical protein [unclassified Acinetobacter]|uniref:DUF7674 family protein n=1 Tax=unclassified Acinetobacter TaxID=196816 RepID=UPI002934DFB7|nr:MULTISPECIES: hypothetical protein [unclassified Acinetobacter]WOE32005.1 hypothetical protein QSG84_01905 [Acinetobacter sp. SAAs470]WOE37473.1 hypothetical protein QSG86_10950 [Acinetobacter sp. SAAs474]
MINQEIFFDKLFDLVPKLRLFYENEKMEWLPDNPPVTFLMSNLAREILKERFDIDIFSKLFIIIEDGVNSEKIGDAVATGFLESLYFNSNNLEKKMFLSLMGVNSKTYIISLCEFHGISL